MIDEIALNELGIPCRDYRNQINSLNRKSERENEAKRLAERSLEVARCRISTLESESRDHGNRMVALGLRLEQRESQIATLTATNNRLRARLEKRKAKAQVINLESARKLHAALTIELGHPLNQADGIAIHALRDDGAIAFGERSMVYGTPEGRAALKAAVEAHEAAL